MTYKAFTDPHKKHDVQQQIDACIAEYERITGELPKVMLVHPNTFAAVSYVPDGMEVRTRAYVPTDYFYFGAEFHEEGL